MRSIYQYASKVLIWLGESSAETCSSLSWVLNHADTGEAGLKFLTGTATTIMDTARDDTSRTDDENVEDRRLRLLKGFEDLLTRDWWSRIWVIQEVVTNSDVTVICGNSEVRWSTFMAFITGLHQSKHLLQMPLAETAHYSRALDHAVSQRQFASQSGQPMADLLVHIAVSIPLILGTTHTHYLALLPTC